MTLDRGTLREQAEALAAARGVTRQEGESWAVKKYLEHLVATGRMALVPRVATPLQVARQFGAHKTELEALSAALDHAASISTST
ncbi:MAG: hypothetical protein JNK82_43870 [Myxococcaceae bacterium]|nr:hypothetical protein [Myxococcaceae bacterium]